MKALNKVIQMYGNVNLVKDANDWLDDKVVAYTAIECADGISAALLAALSDPTVKVEAAKQISLEIAKSVINKRKQLKIIDESGNVDFAALKSMIISVEKGLYLPFQYASIDAIEIKYSEQKKNIDDAINAFNEFKGAVDPIVEYMTIHDIKTAGEAISLMGL